MKSSFKKIVSAFGAFALSAGVFTSTLLPTYAADNIITTVNANQTANIVIDGKIDAAWENAAVSGMTQCGGSSTSATVKVLFGESSRNQHNQTLYVLVEIDKGNATINDTDSVWVALNLYNRNVDVRSASVFDAGIFGLTPNGKTSKQYGGFASDHSSEWASASAKISDNKWVAEYALDILDANTADGKYVNTDGNGFGNGTEIGLSVSVQDGKDTLTTRNLVGCFWGTISSSKLNFASCRAVITGYTGKPAENTPAQTPSDDTPPALDGGDTEVDANSTASVFSFVALPITLITAVVIISVGIITVIIKKETKKQ